MARDKRKGGRVTPKGTRPGHLRPVADGHDRASPLDQIIDSGGRELLEEDDPVGGETWASAMLDMFDQGRLQARLDGQEAPPFEEALLDRCRQRRDKRSVAVAGAFAGVVPAPLASIAASTVAELRRAVPGLPEWIGVVGAAQPTKGWVASDVFGDQDSLIVGFRQEGASVDHALVVLVDHNLSGQAKDAWVASDVDEVVRRWKSTVDDQHMGIEELPVEDVLRQLRAAMAMSDAWNGDRELRTEDFARHRALIWTRLRRAGLTDDQPQEIEIAAAEREALVSEFMAWPGAQQLLNDRVGLDVEILAHCLVDLRCDYEGRPLRWSPTVVSVTLGELAPRKLLLDSDHAAALPEVMRAFVGFSAERTGLERRFSAETLEAIDEVEADYLARSGDPTAAGPAKAVLAALQAQGVDLTDPDAIEAALRAGGPISLAASTPKKRRSGAGAPAAVVASAERAPILGRFDMLAEFFGRGRKLTQTGRPTLADARSLVSMLGTSDRIDEAIGGRVFKTQSAADLPELSFMIRWAVAAGALRKEHGKLLATVAWGKLEGKPMQRWVKAADAMASLGPLAGYQADRRYGGRDEILDELALGVLHMLSGGPVPFEDVVDWIFQRADAMYEWLVPYMQDPEHRRTSFGWDLDLLARILGWAGVAERVGTSTEPDRYFGDRLVGGTLQLTPAGRWWLEGR